jgi:hypothetical protein
MVGLPPPLRGRVGERGMPRAPYDEMRHARAIQILHAIDDAESTALTIRRSTEPGAPPSLTLPRKWGGNGESGASDGVKET